MTTPIDGGRPHEITPGGELPKNRMEAATRPPNFPKVQESTGNLSETQTRELKQAGAGLGSLAPKSPQTSILTTSLARKGTVDDLGKIHEAAGQGAARAHAQILLAVAEHLLGQ